MPEPEISDELLINMLRERGFEVSKPAEPDLAAKVDAIGEKLDEIREVTTSGTERAGPATPEEQRLRFAEALRDRLNASTTPWFTPGDDDAA
jgi:hypothetical protein